MKAMVHSLKEDIDFFNFATEVLQGDTFTLYLFILLLDNARQISIDIIKEYGFTLKKAWSRRYPTKSLIEAD